MAWDLVRNAQNNPHITAEELQKKSIRHRSSCSHENNTTYFKQQRPTRQSCQKEWPQHKMKNWKYAKENTEKPEAFWNNVLWNNVHGGGSIMLWSRVATGGRGNIVWVEGGLDSIKKVYRLMFECQSRHWSWREVGHSSKIQSLPRNQQWNTSRKDKWRFWNCHHSLQTLILLKNKLFMGLLFTLICLQITF